MRYILPFRLLSFIAAAPALFVAVVAHADAWENMPDPTRPAYARAAKPEAVRGMDLQTTLISAGRTLAVIGGRTVRVGSTIGNFVVTDIRAYEVDLKNAAGMRTLRLSPPTKTHTKTTGSTTIDKNKAETLSRAP